MSLDGTATLTRSIARGTRNYEVRPMIIITSVQCFNREDGEKKAKPVENLAFVKFLSTFRCNNLNYYLVVHILQEVDSVFKIKIPHLVLTRSISLILNERNQPDRPLRGALWLG